MSTPECDKYEACVAGACSDISNKCFGPGYKQGSFGGTCKPFYDCAVACGCDNACKTTCGKNMAKDCQDCFTEFGTCSSTNCTADATACSKSVMP